MKLYNWFCRVFVKVEEIPPMIKTKITPDMLNIDKFNEWFVDPENGATYAHAGIFLRSDKLSRSQIGEFLEHIYGPIEIDETDVMNFRDEILKDWKIKISKL